MVEVFKTNVKDRDVADKLIDHIHKAFIGYKANFDLEDCDNILRVKSMTGSIESNHLICFLEKFGCNAGILEDEIIKYAGRKSISKNNGKTSINNGF